MRAMLIALLSLLPLVAQVGLPKPAVPPSQAAPPIVDLEQPPLVGRSDGGPATEIHVAIGEKRIRLDSLPGTIGRTWIYWTSLYWADFPGLGAAVRLQDTLPIFFIAMEKNPLNRLFLVKCRSNGGDRNRSVKLGRAGYFTYKGIQSPDPDWVIPVDIKEEKPGLWRVMPLRSLPPGEYGFFSGAAAAHATKGSPVGELFEFGVDRS